MSFEPANRVLENTTSTGSGALALSAAVTGFRRFNAIPGIQVGDEFHCFIEAVDANGVPTGVWEIGIYRYTAANEITLVGFEDSSTGSAITWAAGTKYVSVAMTAAGVNTNGRTWAVARGFALP